MKLTVNDKEHEHLGDGTIANLLTECGAKNGQVAVMRNGDIVPKDNFSLPILVDGDILELLTFAGGG